jgi:oligopeptide transport system ATP-binding protein
MAAVPVADPEVEARRPRAVISGEVPSAPLPPLGCGFHTRCPRAMAVCKIDQPRLDARWRVICEGDPFLAQ